jgi:hypothetical protein
MTADIFSTSGVLGYGWETFKRNIGRATFLTVTSLLLTFLLVGGIAQGASRSSAVAFGFTLLSQLVHALLSFLWIRFALAIHDARPISTRELFPSGLMFLNFLAVSIMYDLMVTAGLILLVVPGFYLAVRYGFAGFLIVEGRPNPIDAFHGSAELTRGVRGELFLFGVVLLLLNVAGALFCGVFCGVGILLTVPTSAFAAARMYRRLAARAARARASVSPPWPMPA